MAKKIPEGFHTITPLLVVKDGNKTIALYEKALGATLVGKFDMPGTTKVAHACLKIGNSMLFLCDESENCNDKAPGPNGAPTSFYIYVEDADAAYEQARQAGMEEVEKPNDSFWGDRIGIVKDFSGYKWTFATHIREVSMEELQKGAQAKDVPEKV